MLTHLDASGKASMVDVSHKTPTRRVAKARALVWMQAQTMELITAQDIPKGDVLAAMRLAGIMAAKKTAELIFLCHPLHLTRVTLDSRVLSDRELEIISEVVAFDSTGVEMEALTAVTVSALTVVDMCKAVDKGLMIKDIHLLSKSGGMSGDFVWGDER